MTNPADDGNEALFDRAQIVNYAGFVRRSLRRHRLLVLSVVLSIVSLVGGALAVLPRTYHAEAKLLAQRSQVLVVRGDGPDAGVAPTRGAVETIRGRDAILAIIASTDLIRHFEAHRSLSQRAGHALLGLVRRTPETEQDRVDAMVERLEKNLTAWVVDGTVSIGVDWGDAQMAKGIVDAAQRAFLATRRAQEVDALAESIAIVASHGESLKAEVDVEVAALERLRAARQGDRTEAPPSASSPVRGPVSLAPRPAPRPAARVDGRASDASAAIAAKRREADELDEPRKRRLGEAQTRLAEQLRVYTDNHPTIVALKQEVASLQNPSSQVAVLRLEIAALQADSLSKAADQGVSAPATPAWPAGGGKVTLVVPSQLSPEVLRLDGDLREDRDPAMVYARARLRDAMDKVALLRAQVQGAQIDLETAEAAFKYRYTVVTPAQLPRQPIKPDVPLVMIAAFIAALLAGIMAAVWRDVRSGRVIEGWQIERLLGQPILGELVHRLPASADQ
jgi:hypothetical protein